MSAIPLLQESHDPAASMHARRGPRVGIVEDDASLASGLRRTLEDNGYEVYVASDGRDGADAIREVDFILVDAMLPASTGLSVLRTLRHAFLQRSDAPIVEAPRAEALGFGDVRINPAASTVTRGGRAVALTPKEFDLLLAFVRNPGTVLSRTALLHEVWGHRTEVMTRTVDIHVAELRRKLEDVPAKPRHFVTVWKRGYRFDP